MIGDKVVTFHATLTFSEPMLATAPSSPTIYRDFVVAKQFKDALKKAAKQKAGPDPAKAAAAAVAEVELHSAMDAKAEEELALLPPETEENKGATVFRRNDSGLILLDSMARGFMKEGAEALSGTWAVRSKIDKWLYIGKFDPANLSKFLPDRHIPILRDGVQVQQPDGVYERPLRAETQRGPRVTLAASELVNAGCTVSFHVSVLPLGALKGKIDEAAIRDWFEFGQLTGLGQFRTGSFGRFDAVVTKL